jgi:serine/threonine-protein kinase
MPFGLRLVGSKAAPLLVPESGRAIVGSSREQAQLVVQAPGVEPAHCALGRTRAGELGLKDLGSASGTRVNDQRVSAARLKLGDRIGLGSAELVLVELASSASAPSPATSGEPTSAAGATSAAPSGMPARIAGFRLKRRLGGGGMGEVYLAEQESLAREVALKLLSPTLAADADFVRRFQAEARAAAALGHPNVVVVHDVGQDAGQHYLALEYMDKGSLQERVAGGTRLPWREVLGVLCDAARGLCYAEERGIVHRDIKPANLMQNAAGATKIADLGLAASSGEASSGRIFGTPHFIAPEQARGEPADPRSDLYSLGATAYRLLCGRTVFEGESSREILRALQRDTPRPIAELAPDVPLELARFVERLLAKEPLARPASAREALLELERMRAALEHGASEPAGRGRGALAAAAIASLALAGGAWWWWQGRERAPDADLAVQATTPAVDEPPADASAELPAGSDAIAAELPGAAQAMDPAAEAERARLRELEAELALRDLGALEGAVLLAELRAHAAQHAGTAAAASALERAGELEAHLHEQARVGEARAGIELELAQRIAELEPERQPIEALHALFAETATEQESAERSESVEQDAADRQAALDSLAASVIERALAYAASQEELAEERIAAADFAGARAALEELAGFGAAPPPEAPARASELAPVALRASERLADLGGLQTEHVRASELAAQRALAEALRGPNGLEAALRAGEFAALGAHLEALAQQHAPHAAAARARELAAACARLQLVRDALLVEWSRGGWRRRSIADPRPGRSGLREIAEFDADGLALSVEDGNERVSWRALSAQPESLHQLYVGRLAREYDEQERRGIAELLALSGAANAADLLVRAFEPARRERWQAEDLERARAAFAPAEDWMRAAGLDAQLANELAVVQAIGEALLAAARADWTQSSAALERARERGAHSFVHALLSDGSAWPQAEALR